MIPEQYATRAEWLDDWCGKHSTAYHGGDPNDCEHCRLMIEWLGPMPPADELRAYCDAKIRKWHQEKYKQKQPIPRNIRKEVFERDAYRCQHCGGWHDLTVDHIHPESRGGTTALNNLQALCRSCNSRKGAKVT